LKQPLPKPQHRSPLRLKLGKLWFINKRRLNWYFSATRFADVRQVESLSHIHTSHRTPMLRALSGVDMQLQINKKTSLEIAASCIDGLILKPGETFSFWRLVGKPTAPRGFKVGLVLRNGTIQQDVGGGLCQMTNMIYWMSIHTDLKIVERWRHGFDVFPDAGRTQPFASGATCSYNYIDLQITNPTLHTYQLRLRTEGDWLHGSWRCDAAPHHRFDVFERHHEIRSEFWGGYSRHNEIHRKRIDIETGMELAVEFVAENHAILMYQPFLSAPDAQT
jgi:vancomycin resistance protein VanW